MKSSHIKIKRICVKAHHKFNYKASIQTKIFNKLLLKDNKVANLITESTMFQ